MLMHTFCCLKDYKINEMRNIRHASIPLHEDGATIPSHKELFFLHSWALWWFKIPSESSFRDKIFLQLKGVKLKRFRGKDLINKHKSSKRWYQRRHLCNYVQPAFVWWWQIEDIFHSKKNQMEKKNLWIRVKRY